MNEQSTGFRDYFRFHVLQAKSRFSLLDQETGWVWNDIKSYRTVMSMMNHILDHQLEFKTDEYKRIRRLEGHEWEQELTHSPHEENDESLTARN